MTIEVVTGQQELGGVYARIDETDMGSTQASLLPVTELLGDTGHYTPILINESGKLEPLSKADEWVAHEDRVFVHGLIAALATRTESGNIAPYHPAHVAYLHNTLLENPTADIVRDAEEALSMMAIPHSESKDTEVATEDLTLDKIAPKAPLRADKTLATPLAAAFLAEEFSAETMLAPVVLAALRPTTPEGARKDLEQKLRATDLSLRMAKVRGDIDAVHELENYRASLTK